MKHCRKHVVPYGQGYCPGCKADLARRAAEHCRQVAISLDARAEIAARDSVADELRSEADIARCHAEQLDEQAVALGRRLDAVRNMLGRAEACPCDDAEVLRDRAEAYEKEAERRAFGNLHREEISG